MTVKEIADGSSATRVCGALVRTLFNMVMRSADNKLRDGGEQSSVHSSPSTDLRARVTVCATGSKNCYASVTSLW